MDRKMLEIEIRLRTLEKIQARIMTKLGEVVGLSVTLSPEELGNIRSEAEREARVSTR